MRRRLDRLGGYEQPVSLREVFDQTAMGLEPDLTGLSDEDLDFGIALIKAARFFGEIGSGDSEAGYRKFREFCDNEYPETLDDMLDIVLEGFASDVARFRAHITRAPRTHR